MKRISERIGDKEQFWLLLAVNAIVHYAIGHLLDPPRSYGGCNAPAPPPGHDAAIADFRRHALLLLGPYAAALAYVALRRSKQSRAAAGMEERVGIPTAGVVLFLVASGFLALISLREETLGWATLISVSTAALTGLVGLAALAGGVLTVVTKALLEAPAVRAHDVAGTEGRSERITSAGAYRLALWGLLASLSLQFLVVLTQGIDEIALC